ncbi:hypothetical protein M5X11_04375 [Paenibacillus alginolyticus]|uniref:hypothetical protein n=1 Tax=Paenibacillus alginolyticus TaxID=59839 RepID=UPI000422AABF|nr:hypothetical protein [Paenibacillus alginolyticus]MCY9664213.1 hypothetical protein [Paenibacillus alginolyticus]
MNTSYDEQAKKILDSNEISNSEIKELLILSAHSSKKAEEYFKANIQLNNKNY